MKKVAAFVRIIDNINTRIGQVFGFLVIANAGILLYGVIMRYVFSLPVHWGGEIAWTLFILFSLLAGAYVLRQDYHVRLDVVYGRLSAKTKAIMDMATFIFFLLFLVLLTWLTIEKAWWSISVMEKTESYFHGPVYPARICLALASVLLLLQGVAEFMRNVLFISGHEIEGSAK